MNRLNLQIYLFRCTTTQMQFNSINLTRCCILHFRFIPWHCIRPLDRFIMFSQEEHPIHQPPTLRVGIRTQIAIPYILRHCPSAVLLCATFLFPLKTAHCPCGDPHSSAAAYSPVNYTSLLQRVHHHHPPLLLSIGYVVQFIWHNLATWKPSHFTISIVLFHNTDFGTLVTYLEFNCPSNKYFKTRNKHSIPKIIFPIFYLQLVPNFWPCYRLEQRMVCYGIHKSQSGTSIRLLWSSNSFGFHFNGRAFT